MANTPWHDLPDNTLFDGDVQSSASAAGGDTTRIVMNMLRKGMPMAEIACIVDMDLQDVEQTQHSMLVRFDGSAVEAPQFNPEHFARFFKYPTEFLCHATGKLMDNPIVCADGMSYERGAIDLPSNPNFYLKRKIDDFKKGRVQDILSTAPFLSSSGFPSKAGDLLGHAADLVRTSPDCKDMLQDVLELAVEISSKAHQPRAELVKFMADHGKLSELIDRFDALDVATVLGALSLAQLNLLFVEVRAKADNDKSDHLRAVRVAAGRALLVQLDACDSLNGCTASPHVDRTSLLIELYTLDPAADILEKLVSSVAGSVPLSALTVTLEGLSMPVLNAVVEYINSAMHTPPPRAVLVYLAMAKKVGSSQACDLYRRALALDSSCAQASAGLTALLLKDVAMGTATAAAKADLARLLKSERAFAAIATHFEALEDVLDMQASEATFAISLAEALAKSEQFARASDMAAVAATSLELSAAHSEAMEYFVKAFSWDRSNRMAEEGVKRLAVVTGREQQAATQLLMAVVGQDGVAADRVMDAMWLLGSHIQKVTLSSERSLEAKLSQVMAMNKAMATLPKEIEAMKKAVAALTSHAKLSQATSVNKVMAEIEAMKIETDALTTGMDALTPEVHSKQDKPYVEFAGFDQRQLNRKFFRDDLCKRGGLPTYWTNERDYAMSYHGHGALIWGILSSQEFAEPHGKWSAICGSEDFTTKWRERRGCFQINPSVRVTVFDPLSLSIAGTGR